LHKYQYAALFTSSRVLLTLKRKKKKKKKKKKQLAKLQHFLCFGQCKAPTLKLVYAFSMQVQDLLLLLFSNSWYGI